MALFTLPTPADVLDDSGLRIEQINASYTATDATADIAQKIEETAGVVEMRLLDAARPLQWPFSDSDLATAYPSYTTEMRGDFTSRQSANATLACKLFSIAWLYRRAGQLNPRYEEKADQYEARAESLVESLVKSLQWIADEASDSTQGAEFVLSSIPLFDGAPLHCDELARWGAC